MAKIADIPYLIHLLDDETPYVRRQVRSELKGLWEKGQSSLKPLLDEVDSTSRDALLEVFKEFQLERFQDDPYNWVNESDPRKAQEEALEWLGYLTLEPHDKSLKELLDGLAKKFIAQQRPNHVKELFKFLFEEEGFSQPEDQFYHPRNSNLVQVIQNKKGLQISLSMIAVFMGRRLELPLYGFNMPGHFLIYQEFENDFRVYDPFNQGTQIPRQTILYIQRLMSQRTQPLHVGPSSTIEIVYRVFRNYINSYKRQENQEMLELFQEKFEELQQVMRQRG
ncbi:MAG: transglutaminase-like domain-containing protein [Bacteroidia bacterium]|nr:transglutaminase-like domain-containing protein [Bacteroidia bacterium]